MPNAIRPGSRRGTTRGDAGRRDEDLDDGGEQGAEGEERHGLEGDRGRDRREDLEGLVHAAGERTPRTRRHPTTLMCGPSATGILRRSRLRRVGRQVTGAGHAPQSSDPAVGTHHPGRRPGPRRRRPLAGRRSGRRRGRHRPRGRREAASRQALLALRRARLPDPGAVGRHASPHLAVDGRRAFGTASAWRKPIASRAARRSSRRRGNR